MLTVMLVMLSDVTVALVFILLLHWFWGWWTSILSLSGGGVGSNGDIRCIITVGFGVDSFAALVLGMIRNIVRLDHLLPPVLLPQSP